MKHKLEDIITEWRDFERDNNPREFAKKIEKLDKLIPDLNTYVEKYKKEVYQPILKMYFEKTSETFKSYIKNDE